MLLMDEPLAALDAARKAEILPVLERLRDVSRVPILYAVIVIATIGQIVSQFDSVAERRLMAIQLQSLPEIFQGMLGQPIGLERLGGFISWRIMNFLPVVYGIWAIIALSGTLAGELARGSLDVVVATPLARRRVAIQKWSRTSWCSSSRWR
jgi:hypothetical protein